MAPPPPDITFSFQSYIPFNTGNGTIYPGGLGYVIYGCGNNHIRKPILISDGFDPGNQQNYPELYDLLHKTGIYNALNEGYDIIIADYDMGDTYIQANAFAFMDFLQNVRSLMSIGISNTPLSEFIIIGPSMGGLITKYALSYMEQNNIPHHCKLWISFDAPHLGANVPLGNQYLINFFNTYKPSYTTQKYINVLNSPAARQMLIYHYASFPNTLSERNLLLSDPYYNMPQKCKKIAIADGGGRGNNDIFFPSCISMISGSLYKYSIQALYISTKSVPDNSNGICEIFKGHLLFPNLSSVSQSIKVSGTKPYDTSPGGSSDVNQVIASSFQNNPDIQYQLNHGATGGFAAFHKETCFIPTFSLLNIKNIHPYQNIHSLLGNNSNYIYNTQHNISPFDIIIFPYGTNTPNLPHITLTGYMIYDLIASELAPQSLIVDNQIINNEDILEAREDVYMGYIINGYTYFTPPSNINVRAGNKIALMNGLHFSSGSKVKMYISPYRCTSTIYCDFNTSPCPPCPPDCFESRIIETDYKTHLVSGSDVTYYSNQNIQNPSKRLLNIFLYPNPTSSSITLQTTHSSHTIQHISIKDLSGKTLFQQTISLQSSVSIDLSDFSNGLYFIEVQTNQGVFTEKVVVQR